MKVRSRERKTTELAKPVIPLHKLLHNKHDQQEEKTMMKKVFEALMQARCNYAQSMQEAGFDKWAVREKLGYKILSKAIYYTYKQL